MLTENGKICKFKYANLKHLIAHKRNDHIYDRNYDPDDDKPCPKIEGGSTKPRGRPKKNKRGPKP